MNKKLLFVFFTVINLTVFSQNVGIGTTSPTTTLHVVKPANVNDPLRIEGLRLTNTKSHILLVDTLSGIVKHISFDSLSLLISDSINTDDQHLSISNDTLYIEDGNWVVIDHPALGTNLIDSLIFKSSDSIFHLIKDSLYVYISDSLLKDTTWITKLDSLLISKSDSIYFNDTTYSIIRDSLLGDTLFIDSLRKLFPDNINDADSVIGNEYNTSFTIIGTNLTITDGGGPKTVNIAPLLSGLTPITRVALSGNSSHQILVSEGDIAVSSMGNITDTLFMPDATTNTYYEFTITPYGDPGTNGMWVYATSGNKIITNCNTTGIRIRLYGNSASGTCVYKTARLKSDGTDWILMNSHDR